MEEQIQTSATIAQRSSRMPLATYVQDEIIRRIRAGEWEVGEKLPTETAIMAEFAVSRTVVREAITRLQANGVIETKHGIGSFVLASKPAETFRILPEQLGTLAEVIAVLELRIAVETEAAGLAAMRRTKGDLKQLHQLVVDFEVAVKQGTDPISIDFDFHLQVARSTHNHHFVNLFQTLGISLIPCAELSLSGLDDQEARGDYLTFVNREHQTIVAAIECQDNDAARVAMRMHLINSRERRRLSSVQDVE